jgi:hypothetical protein
VESASSLVREKKKIEREKKGWAIVKERRQRGREHQKSREGQTGIVAINATGERKEEREWEIKGDGMGRWERESSGGNKWERERG